MKFVIQRVSSASVTVDDKVIGSIGKGYLILFGAGEGDTKDMLEPFADKIAKMRIFADENGRLIFQSMILEERYLLSVSLRCMRIVEKATDQVLYMHVSRFLLMNYMKNS